MGDNETPVQVAAECSAVFRAHGRVLNRCAPNWTAHLDTFDWWLGQELQADHRYYHGLHTSRASNTSDGR